MDITADTMPDADSHGESASNSSEFAEGALEQYMLGQDGSSCPPRSSGNPYDLSLSPAVSMEQLFAWCQPAVPAGDRDQSLETGTELWDCPGLQGTSTSSSYESEPSPNAALTSWNYDRTNSQRRQSQVLCSLCADRSDRLSLHASYV